MYPFLWFILGAALAVALVACVAAGFGVAERRAVRACVAEGKMIH